MKRCYTSRSSLRRAILAGFDGLLGGYLLLTGPKGLELLDSRYFANPKAAIGDVEHAMRALLSITNSATASIRSAS